jgi:phenylacetate-coenzyme A ligase PaaK-like adenylate-forming protein
MEELADAEQLDPEMIASWDDFHELPYDMEHCIDDLLVLTKSMRTLCASGNSSEGFEAETSPRD